MSVYQKKDGYFYITQYDHGLMGLMSVSLVSPDNSLYQARWRIRTLEPTDESAINFCNFLKKNCRGHIKSDTALPNGAFLMRQDRIGSQEIKLEDFLDYGKFKAIASDPELGHVLYISVWSRWANIRYGTKYYAADGRGRRHMIVESSIKTRTVSRGLAELVKETYIMGDDLDQAVLAGDLKEVFEQLSHQRAK